MTPAFVDARPPQVPAPLGACDCHFHVFGDPERYPPSKPGSGPLAATITEAERMHRTLGIARGVIVQPMLYGTDHRLLIDCLHGDQRYRGVAIIDDSVTDHELGRMHEAGVRGVRLNLSRAYPPASRIPRDREAFERTVARVAKLGWHVKILAMMDDLLTYESWLRPLKLTVVVDHLAAPDAGRGLDQPGFDVLLQLLKQDNWWMLLANGDRRSVSGFPWDDIAPFVRAYVDVAPDRTIWATNWPPALGGKPELPNPADLLEFFYRCVPDPAKQKKILVDNAARLYFD